MSREECKHKGASLSYPKSFCLLATDCMLSIYVTGVDKPKYEIASKGNLPKNETLQSSKT